MKYFIYAIWASLIWTSHAVADSPQTPEEAIASFRALWKDSLAEKLKTKPYSTLLKHLVYEPDRVWASKISSEEEHKSLTRILSPKDMERVILVGSLEDLKPDRQVWAVINPGGGPGFEAYLDPKDGRLIMLWIREEG